MIKSLNVNQFLGRNGNWDALKGNFLEKIRIWNEIKRHYFDYILNSVKTKDDVLILHEVPFVDEEPYSYKNEIKYKRSNNVTIIYSELKKFCDNNELNVLLPNTGETAFFRTVVICKKNENIVAYNAFKFKDYFENRVIAVRINNANTLIVGVHIPDSSNKDVLKYWEQLIDVISNESKEQRIVCIGDFNTFNPGTTNKKKLYELMSHDLVDIWLEQGNSHNKETFDKGTRIDYALTTGKDYETFNMKMYVDDEIREKGYSDHSAIYLIEN